MSMVEVLVLAGIAALVVLIAVFLKMRQRDHLDAILKKRQPSSKLTTRAEYVEGMERIPVALALTGDTFYYENPDLEASFELARIDEIEYDNELTTGKTVPDNCQVMRLRSHGAAFEFLLEKPEVAKWTAALPPRRIGEPAAQAAV
jgi:hypothetical protein